MLARLGLAQGRALALDGALAVAGLLALAATMAGLADATAPGARVWVVPLFALPSLALLWRRRAPLPVVALVWIPMAVQAAVTGQGSEGLHLLLPAAVALYSVGAYGTRAHAAAGLAIAVAGDVVHDINDPAAFADATSIWAWAFWTLVQLAVWILGLFVGARLSERLERDRATAVAQRSERAVAEERARIARELHDVVTHNVNVVVLQAMAASGVLDDAPQRARAPLAAIESSGREALTEMRRLLGMLRDNQTPASRLPQPGLDRLDALITAARETGVPVSCTVQGEPHRLSAAVSLAAYRVVQEALTNALKHAGGAAVHVRIGYSGDAVEVEVLDEGCGSGEPVGQGHGLIGMRERVSLYGGELTVGPRPDGGFRVRARLPTSEQPAPTDRPARP